MSVRRAVLLGALTLPAAIFACGPDPFPIEHLGPVGAPSGTFRAPAVPPRKVEPPAPRAGLDTPCGAPSPFSVVAPASSAFGGLATAKGKVVLSVGGHGYTFAASSTDGCLGAALAGPYQEGLGAIAFDGATVWAATSSGVLALSPAGAVLASCATTAQALASDPSTGTAYAIDGGGVRGLSIVNGLCSVTTYTIAQKDAAPARAIAASSASPGTFWLVSSEAGKPLTAARYSAPPEAPGETKPLTARTLTGSLAGVCDVAAIAELAGRLLVVDPACGRVWSFPIATVDPQSAMPVDPFDAAPPRSASLTAGLQPVAIAPSPLSANAALVAERAAIDASSSVVQLSHLLLP